MLGDVKSSTYVCSLILPRAQLVFGVCRFHRPDVTHPSDRSQCVHLFWSTYSVKSIIIYSYEKESFSQESRKSGKWCLGEGKVLTSDRELSGIQEMLRPVHLPKYDVFIGLMVLRRRKLITICQGPRNVTVRLFAKIRGFPRTYFRIVSCSTYVIRHVFYWISWWQTNSASRKEYVHLVYVISVLSL